MCPVLNPKVSHIKMVYSKKKTTYYFSHLFFATKFVRIQVRREWMQLFTRIPKKTVNMNIQYTRQENMQ